MNRQTIGRLLSFCRPYMKYLYFALICSSGQIIFTLLIPVFIGQAVDHIIGKGLVEFDLLFQKMLWILMSVIIAEIFDWLVVRLSNRMTYSITKDLRNQLFQKYSTLPLRYIDQHAHGDLLSRMINDIDLIGDGLLQGFTHLFNGIATIIGTICFMLYIQTTVALIVIVLTPLSLVVATIIANKTYKFFQEQLALRGELGAYVEEMIGGVKVIKAFGYEQKNQERFEEINQRVYVSGVKSQFLGALANPSTRVVNNIVYASVCIAGSLYVIAGYMTVGALSSFLSYANQYTKPFNEISNVFTELQTALACATRVFHLLDTPSEPQQSKTQTLAHREGHVQIQNLAFSYDPNKPLIENLNVEAKPGQTIAIVGPTGCGKTTLINLLMRFYEPQQGQILIDGINIQNMSREYVRSLYGMVLQDSWLFQGTIKENIAYGQKASDEEIIAAAKKAHAHKFIIQLKDGYDTLISEDGGNLSQGQRQLLCIARIMLVKPPMLILDEATSSIDTRTERQIQEAFDLMMKGRTTFIVAHRLSTIQKADQILVMNHGQIIEQGKHEELLEQHGFYHHLYYSQFDIQK
ncbi:ABC transporter ATP-binding protein [Massilimicrobiota timonensis]|uniref:ABC transporter ATP-binding protein n=1 Tax=Massilimicrobiota timonensis TaxID=1776392 RepID=UPI0019615ADB|nr:ABC transporter ATP-binding protein [Massilimicrobiota timonensis]MBM6966150.1 ABC transporter ATP-binding protein [Massilimicrobiota timonensis]